MSDTDDLLNGINLLASVPSVLACLWMSYFCLKSRSTSISRQLILALGISDLLYSIGNLITTYGPDEGSVLCNIEGFSIGFFSSTSTCLVASIAILHYKQIVTNEYFNRTKFVASSIGISTLLSLSVALRYLDLRYNY